MESKMTDLLSEVATYYSTKLLEHGNTPQGVDWNSTESQCLRFEQLTQILPKSQGFSINDLGCGYGALLDYLTGRYRNFHYAGYDVSQDMVKAARSMSSTKDNPEINCAFHVASEPLEIADYGVASGIFNVQMKRSNLEWQSYIESTIDTLNRTSRFGFAFNCLTSYSDASKMQNHLYYANPCLWFDRCKQLYSRQVALLHDYGLYEFTILVRKS
jgi:SAM-dependent methyltransferase